MVGGVSTRPPAVNDAKNALHLMDLVEKAYRSAKTGRMITV